MAAHMGCRPPLWDLCHARLFEVVGMAPGESDHEARGEPSVQVTIHPPGRGQLPHLPLCSCHVSKASIPKNASTTQRKASTWAGCQARPARTTAQTALLGPKRCIGKRIGPKRGVEFPDRPHNSSQLGPGPQRSAARPSSPTHTHPPAGGQVRLEPSPLQKATLGIRNKKSLAKGSFQIHLPLVQWRWRTVSS